MVSTRLIGGLVAAFTIGAIAYLVTRPVSATTPSGTVSPPAGGGATSTLGTGTPTGPTYTVQFQVTGIWEVSTPSTQTIGGALITVTGPNGFSATATSAPDGTFEMAFPLTGDPTTTYTFTITAPGQMSMGGYPWLPFTGTMTEATLTSINAEFGGPFGFTLDPTTILASVKLVGLEIPPPQSSTKINLGRRR